MEFNACFAVFSYRYHRPAIRILHMTAARTGHMRKKLYQQQVERG